MEKLYTYITWPKNKEHSCKNHNKIDEGVWLQLKDSQTDTQTKCQMLDLCRVLNIKLRLCFARSTPDDDMHTPCPHTVVLIKCGNFTQQINLVGTFFSFNCLYTLNGN